MVKASRMGPAASVGMTGSEVCEAAAAAATAATPPNLFYYPMTASMARLFVDSRRYDEDHGRGAMQDVVTNIWLEAAQRRAMDSRLGQSTHTYE